MAQGKKIRLDILLTEKGYFPSRARAQAALMAGEVLVDGKKDLKPGDQVVREARIEIIGDGCPYVSRGGTKLDGALNFFGVNPMGYKCLDVGASTGGFTDCLLQRQAKTVTSLDVGKGLIDWKLRTNDRVDLIESVNARLMDDDIAPGPYDLTVMDVSFISLRLIFPKIPQRMKENGEIIALIKPQFEAGKEYVEKGFVKDKDVWRKVLMSFADEEKPFGDDLDKPPSLHGICISPITGGKGNVEFFGYWKNKPEGNPGSVSGFLDNAIAAVEKMSI